MDYESPGPVLPLVAAIIAVILIGYFVASRRRAAEARKKNGRAGGVQTTRATCRSAVSTRSTSSATNSRTFSSEAASSVFRELANLAPVAVEHDDLVVRAGERGQLSPDLGHLVPVVGRLETIRFDHRPCRAGRCACTQLKTRRNRVSSISERCPLTAGNAHEAPDAHGPPTSARAAGSQGPRDASAAQGHRGADYERGSRRSTRMLPICSSYGNSARRAAMVASVRPSVRSWLSSTTSAEV